VTTTTTAPRPLPRVGSSDPYEAAVDYVACMRGQGIALPDPKPNGDIDLTEEDEERIGPPGPKNEAADRKCFRFLRNAVKTKPLSKAARGRIVQAMQPFIRCMRKYGYEMGQPQVRNMSRGRVRIWFRQAGDLPETPRMRNARIECEEGQTARLDAAIGDER
jgi:hypothetical protein